MLKKTVEISGQEVTFKCSAAVPRMYRIKFGRDIIVDIQRLSGSLTKKVDEGKEFEIEDLECFGNVAYIMALHADPTIPPTIDEWLEQFEMFSILEILPVIMDLWGINMETTSEPAKKSEAPQEN